MKLTRAAICAFAALALSGCVQPSETTGFASRSKVHHPEALFDVAYRSDQLRGLDTRKHSSKRPIDAARGAAICPRASDLKPYDDLMAQSIVAMRGPTPVEYSKLPRQFAHELTISAYRTLMDLDMTGPGETSTRCAPMPPPTPGSRPGRPTKRRAPRSRPWARCCPPG